MIGIDTFSWTKIFLLFKESWEDLLSELLSATLFFITHDVEKELLHFHREREPIWRSGAILPKLDRSYSAYVLEGFDEADASLLEYAELSEHIIVTEDAAMLAKNVTSRNNIIQLIDLLRKYYENDLLDPKEYHTLVKWFRERRNITKKKERRLMERLKES